MTSRSFAVLALLLAIAPAHGVPTRLVLDHVSGPEIHYGSTFGVHGHLRYPGVCPTVEYLPQVQLTGVLDGRPSSLGHVASWFSCSVGEISRFFTLRSARADFGPHEFEARFDGSGDLEPSFGGRFAFTVVPHHIGSAPGGLGPVSIGVPDGGGFAAREIVSLSVTESAQGASAPPPLRFPYGFVNFYLFHYEECDSLCPPRPLFRVMQDLRLEMPGEIPHGATVWVYLPSKANPSPEWLQVPVVMEGRRFTVSLAGGWIGGRYDDPVRDPLFRGSLAVAMPASLSPEHAFQDMWWGGPGEDGWGIAIAQEGERLFVTLLVYDGDGTPMWLVMPQGSWDPARSGFSGELFRPSGTHVGAAIGRASLVFTQGGRGTLHYTIYGATGSKSIERMALGAAPVATDPHNGVWDLTLAGSGGMTLTKRGDTTFLTWLHFPGGGFGQWMVAPAGRWTAQDTFEADLYRTTSSPWVGTDYKASRLRIAPAGSIRIRLTGADEAEVSYTIDGVAGSSPVRRRRF